MTRLLLLLRHEIGLVRTASPLHLVAVLQPSVMLLLIGWVFLEPTFEMWVEQPTTPAAQALVEAMPRVGSPTVPYPRPPSSSRCTRRQASGSRK